MKKITLFQTISILIIVFNIFNYFFLTASYTGDGIKESSTFFSHTFISSYTIDGSAGDNDFLGFILIPIIDLYILYVLVFKVPKFGDYLAMPYSRIYAGCAVGILAHVFVFCFAIQNGDMPYFMGMFKGMLLNLLWIIGYFVIIEFFYIIKKQRLSHRNAINTKLNAFDVMVIGIMIELVLSFFYCSLVNRFVIHGVTRDGIEYTRYRGQLFFSQFMMMFKQKNSYGFDGKIEGYPYMIICLVIIIAQLIIAVLKPKKRVIILGVLSLINVVILTIGLCDMCDSNYTNFINRDSRNFFKLVGVGYYYIIFLNIAIPCVYLSSIGRTDMLIIGTDEIEDIVMNDAKKINEKQEEDNIYVIEDYNENKTEENNEGDDINEVV